jgi:CheY-like chemotaxis protein
MKARILIVDDNAINLKLAAATLRYDDHEVTTAEDAESAQGLISTGQEFDLILMDVSLPKMDGLTYTRLLKADPRTAHIPVVILTAAAMRGDEQNARRAGADGFISKPINVGTFPQAIAQYLKPTA